MKKMLFVIFVLVFVWSLAETAYAQTGKGPLIAPAPLNNFNNYINEPVMSEDGYIKSDYKAFADSPVEKGGFGVINTATAWTEIPKQIAETTDQSNIVLGATVGLGMGVVSGIARGVSGAYDMVTCGLPPYDKPLIKPEYKSADPNKELKLNVFSW